MKSTLLLSFVAICLASLGCTVCSSPFDQTYSAFGGSWERDVEDRGRVGSAFSNVGFRAESAEEVETPPAQPDEAMDDPMGELTDPPADPPTNPPAETPRQDGRLESTSLPLDDETI